MCELFIETANLKEKVIDGRTHRHASESTIKVRTYIQDTKYVPLKPLMRSNTSINKIEEQERVQREEQEQVQHEGGNQ
jgi:hypothetical protein